MTTSQEQHQLAAEWHQAVIDEKPFYIEEAPKGTNIWQPFDGVFCFSRYDYRRKPQPKLISWTFEDITPDIAGAWIRCNTILRRIVGFSFSGLILGGYPDNNTVNWEQLKNKYEYSTDLKTWNPCGKVVNE